LKQKPILSQDIEIAFEELWTLVVNEGNLLSESKDGELSSWILKDIIVSASYEIRAIQNHSIEAKESANGRVIFNKGNRTLLYELCESEKHIIARKLLKAEARAAKEKEEAGMTRGEILRAKWNLKRA